MARARLGFRSLLGGSIFAVMVAVVACSSDDGSGVGAGGDGGTADGSASGSSGSGSSGSSGAGDGAANDGAGSSGLLADGGLPDGNTVSGGACAEYAKAIHDARQRCSGLAVDQSAASDIAAATTGCANAVAAAGSGITPATLATCTASLETLTDCNALHLARGGGPDPSCHPAGTLAAGASCSNDTQCASGACNGVAGSACGTCGTPAAEGESCIQASCGAGLECANQAPNVAICVKAVADGQACDATHPCATGACISGACTSAAGVGPCVNDDFGQRVPCAAGAIRMSYGGCRCMMPSKLGGPCTVGALDSPGLQICEADLYCMVVGDPAVGVTGTCQPTSKAGAPCSPQFATPFLPQAPSCVDGSVCVVTAPGTQGSCVAPLAVGATCRSAADCGPHGICKSSGNPVTNRCVHAGSLNEPCVGLLTCDTGLTCTTFHGTCVTLPPAGQPCVFETCAAGAFCAAETCKPIPAVGEPCPDNHCSSDAFCDTNNLPLRCRLPAKIGDACDVPGDKVECPNDSLCIHPAGSASGTCTAAPTLGQACDNFVFFAGAPCADELTCVQPSDGGAAPDPPGKCAVACGP